MTLAEITQSDLIYTLLVLAIIAVVIWIIRALR